MPTTIDGRKVVKVNYGRNTPLWYVAIYLTSIEYENCRYQKNFIVELEDTEQVIHNTDKEP